ncbi:hypothetical protein [Clostridium sp. JN-1]|uniref:hypothetical protein n=1 Tax=Clostridium sp. JN-1 TaxID=2483110 RepID=UPI000F0B642A|nr:hypothetical protein [Clostridium sp. JN-1]
MSNDLNFDSLYGNAQLDMECPKCKSKIPYTLNDAGKTITCPHCKTGITLKKDSNFDSTKESVNKSLDDLKKMFDDFGK